MVDQDWTKDALRFAQDLLQGFLHVLLGVGKRDDANGGALPDVVKIELRNGDVEFAAQAVLEAAENLALVLQRTGMRDVQFERQ